jgi:hypothetical protein
VPDLPGGEYNDKARRLGRQPADRSSEVHLRPEPRVGSGASANSAGILSARCHSQPLESRGALVNSCRRLFGIDRYGTFRHVISGLLIGTLGAFVFGLATLVVFTLTFGDCISLFGNKSPSFVLSPIVRWHQWGNHYFFRAALRPGSLAIRCRSRHASRSNRRRYYITFRGEGAH